MKPRTPEDLAKGDAGKDKYTLYLDNNVMAYLRSRAEKAGTSVSKLVNEAITAYAAQIKDRKNE